MIKVFVVIVLFTASCLPVAAQYISIIGNIKDQLNEPLYGVNISVKGKNTGTTSDDRGIFHLEVKSLPPILLEISMIGFKSQQIEINQNILYLEIILADSVTTLDEVQVYAPSRTEERIMQSPVSIEKIGSREILQVASDDYYRALSVHKGVEMITSSINAQIINTRGFAMTNNSRFVQLLDGMDMQSPTLNFPFGSGSIPSSLDIDNIEILPGAASALYGPNAYNGIMLVTTKSPFTYQGLSANVKLGFNHFGNNPAPGEPSGPQALYEVDLRYAKAFKNRFAFKVNLSVAQANDWHADNYSDKNAGLQGDLTIDPAYDGVNLYGDDGGFNLGLLRNSQDLINMLSAMTGLGTDTIAPYVASLPATNINRTGYPEYTLASYNAKNIKFNAELSYRITRNTELSYFITANQISTIITSAQRNDIKNATNQKHKLEITGDSWNLMGYASFENSGDSYIIDYTGYAINNAYLKNSTWFGTYAGTFAGGLLSANIAQTGSPVYNSAFMNALLGNPDVVSNLHNLSRSQADANRWEAGSDAFQHAFDSINRLVMPDGAKLKVTSRFYHAEGQYNFRKEIHFLDLLVGANWRMYDLRSDSTVYADSKENPIRINEFGGFAEASKNFFKNHLRLMLSLRFDKSQNFQGQFSPRFSGVYTFFKNHNIRLSCQTGFRMPTTQGQYIDMDVITARVIGGLQASLDKYRISEWCYTQSSVDAFTQSAINGNPDPTLLVRYVPAAKLEPEHIQVVEAGYRGMLFNRLMIDAYYYYNIYDHFLSNFRVRQAQDSLGNPVNPFTDPTQAAFYGLMTGNSHNTFQLTVNNPETVKSEGIAIGLDWIIYRGYRASANYAWNHLINKGLPENFINDYNTPEHVVNMVFGNAAAYKGFGFNLAWRWQDAFTWNSTFAMNGRVPPYNTIDAQISYKFRKLKTILKLGGSNILNSKYVTYYGGPAIGAVYYLSITFDELMD